MAAAINRFFTRWYQAIHTLSTEYPKKIVEIAEKKNTNSFIPHADKGQLPIDAALGSLLISAEHTPQSEALRALIKASPSNVTYDPNSVENAVLPVATAMMTRLEELLLHVGSDLDAFLSLAANGAFSAPLATIMKGTAVLRILNPLPPTLPSDPVPDIEITSDSFPVRQPNE
ncbi:MAG: hypothetical protein Q9169_002805 [Polycauliona sp. 2 TL-2023]